MLVTVTGVVRFVYVPSPSWPTWFNPQQYSAPFRMPQAWLSPAENVKRSVL
jgi:hypothetical protein